MKTTKIIFKTNPTPATVANATAWNKLNRKQMKQKKARDATILEMNEVQGKLLKQLDLGEGIAFGTEAVIRTTEKCTSSSWKLAFEALESTLRGAFNGTGRIGVAKAREVLSSLAIVAKQAHTGISEEKPRIKLFNLPIK